MKRRLSNIKRPKGAFGADGTIVASAIAAAAATTTAATIKGAKAQADAVKQGAKDQADATIKNAETSANAIQAQTDENNKLMTQQIETAKQFHEEQKALSKEQQLNLQLMAGNEATKKRQDASRITAARGGRRKLSLRGVYNNIDTTDGGYMIPKGRTEEGYPVVKFIGDSHSESHKLPNGKRATGIGVDLGNITDGRKAKSIGGSTYRSSNKKYNGTSDLEVEGGEYGIITPTDLLVLSKRNIRGFNPAKAVEHGLDPLAAYVQQEKIKRQTASNGGGFLFFNQIGNEGNANLTNYANEAMALNNIKNENVMKYGGSIKTPRRRKLAFGDYVPLMSSGINFLGNIIGSGITTSANNVAKKYMTDAYNKRSEILTNAYRNLKGIDPSIISKDNFRAAHYMPVLQSTQVNTGSQNAEIDRAANRQADVINKNSISGAAKINRLNTLEGARLDRRRAVYDAAMEMSRQRQAANAEAMNDAAEFNAHADTQASKDFNDLNYKIATYNNEIANSKILGIADAQSGTTMDIANLNANTRQANAQSWASTIQQGGRDLGTGLNTTFSNIQNRQNIMFGADTTAAARYLGMNGSEKDARRMHDALIAAGDTQNANIIASLRGWNKPKKTNNSNIDSSVLYDIAKRNAEIGNTLRWNS